MKTSLPSRFVSVLIITFLASVGMNVRAAPATKAATTADATAYDLVVYEATPGGIAMAVRAAREALNLYADGTLSVTGFRRQKGYERRRSG